MSEPVKPWVRSIRHHTYWNSPREPDTFYQVDTEQDAETLVALKMAVREDPPATAARESVPPVPNSPPARGRRTVAPMTSSDFKPKA